jgi:hypothetical protein
MTDITEIITVALQILMAIVSIVLIPLIKNKVSAGKLETASKWLEIAVQAAEEAARKGLIDKSAKYTYAKRILEARGVTFDADTVQALIDSTCWQLFNQFKANSGE